MKDGLEGGSGSSHGGRQVLIAAGPVSARVHAFSRSVVSRPTTKPPERFNGPTGIIPRDAIGKLPSGGQGAQNACS
jgi:hypothetical protein